MNDEGGGYPELLFVTAEDSYGNHTTPSDASFYGCVTELEHLSDYSGEVIAVYRLEELRRVQTSVTLEDPDLERLDLAKLQHPAGSDNATR